MGVALAYGQAFDEAVREITGVVLHAAETSWDAVVEVNRFTDLVYVKNPDRVVVHANAAYSAFFSPTRSPVGRSGEKFLGSTVVNVSKATDDFILSGSTSVELDHVGHGADGALYRFRTYKHNLAPAGNPGIAILGVTRPEHRIDDGAAELESTLIDRHRLFRSLSDSDRDIARLIGMGVTGREIAERLELTARAVELRKKRVLSTLGLRQTVDLIKLLVRLEDRGFVDLGL